MPTMIQGGNVNVRKASFMRRLAVGAVLAGVLVGCGSDDEGGETADTTATAETTATGDTTATADTTAPAVETVSEQCAIPKPASEVAVDVMGWEFPIVTQYGLELKDCEEGGSYKFNIQYLDSAEAQSQITLDLETGKPTYEMVQGSNDFITELGNKGLLTPLNDLVEKYKDQYGLGDIPQSIWDLMSVDGQIYSIPLVSNTQNVFYNKAIFDELGLTVPTTFDEAIAQCKTLIDAGYAGFHLNLAADWAWQIEFDNVLGALGVKPLDEATNAPKFNGAEGLKAAETLAQLVKDCGGKTIGTYSSDDIQNAFQTGEFAIGQVWASRAASMDDAEATKPEVLGNIQFAPALSMGGSVLAAPAYADGYAIPKGVEGDVEALFLAMVAAADEESQTAAAAFGSVTRTGISNPEGPRNGEAALKSASEGRGPDQSIAAGGIYRAEIGKALVKILDGGDPKALLAEAEAAYLAEAKKQGLVS